MSGANSGIAAVGMPGAALIGDVLRGGNSPFAPQGQSLDQVGAVGPNRFGFTLVQTIVTLVVIGLISIVALPRFQSAVAQSNLRSSRTKIVSLYAKARAVAIESSRTATLRIQGNKVYVIAQPRRNAGAGTVDTVTGAEDVQVQYGVVLNGDVDVRVAPTGLGLDAATLILTKGSYKDTISISQFGQVLK